MNSGKLHLTTSLRFRRWSRKSYAVFCSLTSQVTIGVLSVSVSGTFVRKMAGSLCLNTIFGTNNDKAEYDPETDDLVPAQQELEQILILNNTQTPAAAGSLFYFYTYNCKG